MPNILKSDKLVEVSEITKLVRVSGDLKTTIITYMTLYC